MLQENSQEVRRFRVLESLSVAVAIFLFFGVCALLAICMVFIMDTCIPNSSNINWLRVIAWTAIVLGVISGVAFLFSINNNIPTGDWLAEIRAGTIILDDETKKVVEVRNEDVVLIKNHPYFGVRYQFLCISNEQSIQVSVHPLTENPKVRDITCVLDLKIEANSCSGLQTLFDYLRLNDVWEVRVYEEFRSLVKGEIVWDTPAKSMLHDFCNAHSRELSELFNPFRKEQQEEFKRLVNAYFDPLLAQSGIQIKDCRFLVQ